MVASDYRLTEAHVAGHLHRLPSQPPFLARRRDPSNWAQRTMAAEQSESECCHRLILKLQGRPS
jgi:hypothetical protein